MLDHGEEEHLDVLRDDVVAAFEQRPRAGGALQCQRAAYRGAQVDDLELPRGAHEGDDPALKQVVDVDVLDGGLQRAEIVDADDRLQPVERVPAALVADE